MPIVFCKNLGGMGEFTIKIFQKSTNISAIVQHMRVSFVFLVPKKISVIRSIKILQNIFVSKVIYITSESRKSHGSTAVSRRKVLLFTVIFEEGLLILLRIQFEENFSSYDASD